MGRPTFLLGYCQRARSAQGGRPRGTAQKKKAPSVGAQEELRTDTFLRCKYSKVALYVVS